MSYDLTLEKIYKVNSLANDILTIIASMRLDRHINEDTKKFQKAKLRRLRTATSEFAKIAKDYRKVSIEYEKSCAGKEELKDE